MKQEIINDMIQIVESTMESFKDDFYSYDMEFLRDTEAPFAWAVSKNGTHIASLDLYDYIKDAKFNEARRFKIMNEPRFVGGSINYCMKQRGYDYFFYNGKMLHKVTPVELKQIIDPLDYTLKEMVKDMYPHEQKYYNKHIKIEFATKQTRHDFLDILRTDEGYKLMNVVERFRHWMRCGVNHNIIIGYDFCDKSFSFAEYLGGKVKMNGGIIYDGNGWSMHT